MEALNEKEKRFLAFSLFSMGMKVGPVAFSSIEKIVRKTDTAVEFEYYAKDWLAYSERNKITPTKANL